MALALPATAALAETTSPEEVTSSPAAEESTLPADPAETTPADPAETTPAPDTLAPAEAAIAAVYTPVSDLPSMFIELTDPDPTKNTLDYIHASKDNQVISTVNVVDPSNPANTLVDLPAVMKGRGNFTWNLEKKPYQIKFTTKTPVLGMATSRTWVLLANHADTSLMRNKLTYDLAADFGLAYSPESRYVDLTVNGEYLGNYLLSEKTEVGTNRVALANDDGMLLELDNNYGLAEDFHFSTAASNTLFVLKDAKLNVGIPLDPVLAAAYQDIQTYINQFETLLYAPDPNWSAISSMIDVDSFIKYYFVFEVAENPEIARSSVYFYKDGGTDVLHAGPVWDFDSAVGNYRVEFLGGVPTADYVKNILPYRTSGNDWFTQLFRNEEFVERVNDMYETELADDINALPADIDLLEVQLQNSAALNFELWPILGEPHLFGTNGHVVADTWAGEVDYLRDWVTDRVEYLDTAYAADMPLTQYSTHVATIGWQNPLTNGMIAGTTGLALPVEALDIDVSDTALTGGISGNAHVQNIGWMGWVAPGSIIGTTGRSLQLEAIQLKLTGELAAYYDISYRVHVENVGWMDWVANGATAGTTGLSQQIEAIQIRLAEKTEPVEPPAGDSSTVYSSHIESIGWMPSVSDGAVSGTTGRALRMEALRLDVDSTEYTGDILYRAHVQDIGWMPWVTSASMIGTTGRALRMEAFEIKLTGELAAHYSIRYRAHVENIGWQDWVSNGATAGTSGQAKRVEAVMIELVPLG